jgi:glycosyltransferase involved in cell wall biosynthesis
MLFDNSIGRRKEAHKALAAADVARDARDWATAARTYRKVLDFTPERADIFVQYGHALKESGNLDAAEEAYRRAIALDGDVADFHLQLGHALKLLGRIDEARESYRRAHELVPELAAAAAELLALDPDFTLSQIERAQCIAIDLSDVFLYLRHHPTLHHPTLSGIQRVQIGLAQALLSLRGEKRDLTFIVDAGDLGTYVALRMEAIPRIFTELSREQVSHARLLQVMSEEVGLASLFTATRGDIVVVVGAFWAIADAVQRYAAVKRAGGRLVVVIHDLIPITHPEYCDRSLTEVFTASCAHVLQIADFVLTVSDYSGRQVASYLAARNIQTAPAIRTLRLAHTLPAAKVSRAPAPSGSSTISRLIAKPFVLYVSTIEIRKNHALLFRIWKQLIAKHGAAQVPRLIFVGRPGWQVDALMEQLENTRRLDGAIVMLHGLSDVELATLYKHALFTAFPSFEEGWGLPIGEGLTHARPCLASNTSSIPEVVGDFALYADPFNFNESFELYERMIFDAAGREALANRIKASFQPRTWADVARDFMELINRNLKPSDNCKALVPIPKIKAGRLTYVGHRGDMSAFVRHGIGELVYFLFQEGWGAIEDFGRWMIRRVASLEFGVDGNLGTEALLILNVTTPTWLSSATTVTVTVNGRRFGPGRLPQGQLSRLAFRCPVPDSRIFARFEVDGEIAMGSDPRQISYGLTSFAYARLDDIAARLDLLEQLTFESANVKTLEPEDQLFGL